MNRTYLGIDYGRRRIGVAKSDATGLIASALTTLEVRSVKDATNQVLQLIEEIEPNGLVFGYPMLASGDKSDMCEEIDRFISGLQKSYEGPVHRIDERHTSQEAAAVIHAHGKKTGKDKKRIDRLAAVIILQQYLDENPA